MTLSKKGSSCRDKSLNAILSPKFLFFLLLAVLFSNFGQEGLCTKFTFTWDANNEPDLAGYKIYSGVQSRNYQGYIDVGNVTTYSFYGLDVETPFYAAVTAYNTRGLESGFSNEVIYNEKDVVYSAPSCSYLISPSSISFPAAGGSGSVRVTTQAGCNWGISTAPSWVTIHSGSGTGNGMMRYTISPNTGITSRVASLTVAGNVLTVTETGLPAHTLAISKNGSGDGSVSANPAGTTFAPGSRVILNATPDVNSVFSGWSGACSGKTSTCQVNMNSNLNVTASFSSKKNTLILSKGSATSVTLNSARIASNVDFNHDGKTDILWRHKKSGQIAVWYMNGINPTGSVVVADYPDLDWVIFGVGDFNHDGKTDILWRHKKSGQIAVWYMNGINPTGSLVVADYPDLDWVIFGVGDFNHDGKTDILWRHKKSGQIAVWYMNGVTHTGTAVVDDYPDLDWVIFGVGDFNHDGKTDILWRHKKSGQIAVWYMNGVTHTGTAVVDDSPDLDWVILGVGDFNHDSKPDILWRHKKSGQIAVWYMNGITQTGTAVITDSPDPYWVILGP